jgi:hypothetical protein
MPAAKLYNLARMTTPSTGTGTLALGAAVPSFLSFAQADVQDGDTVTYAIEDGLNREIGRGVYSAASGTLTRAVLKSTNGDAPINLSGAAQVFITAAKEDFPIAAAGTANFLPKWDANAALTATSLTSDDGSKVQINANSAPPPAALGAPFNVVQSDGAFNRIGLDSFSERCGVSRRRANGTNASKTSLQANDIIGVDQYFGYGATGYSVNRRAEIGAAAAENWTDTAQGTYLYFATNPKGQANPSVERMRIDDAGNVGINNAAPSATLDVSANSDALPTAVGTVRVALANGVSAGVVQGDSFGGFGVFLLRRANNTAQSPQAVNNGDQLGQFGWRAYTGTQYPTGSTSTLKCLATETCSDTNQGSCLTFETTPNGSTVSARAERLRIDQDGTLLHRAQATVIVDANSHLGLRSYTVATLPSASLAARLIYVSDGTSNKRLAASDGTNWRFPDGAIVS